jgi:hypothetical protein
MSVLSSRIACTLRGSLPLAEATSIAFGLGSISAISRTRPSAFETIFCATTRTSQSLIVSPHRDKPPRISLPRSSPCRTAGMPGSANMLMRSTSLMSIHRVAKGYDGAASLLIQNLLVREYSLIASTPAPPFVMLLPLSVGRPLGDVGLRAARLTAHRRVDDLGELRRVEGRVDPLERRRAIECRTLARLPPHRRDETPRLRAGPNS